MRSTFLRALLMVAVLPALLVAFASSASGVTWWSKSSPLVVREDGVGQGKAYGNFYNSENTYAKNKAIYADLRPGGNAVRVETDFQFYEHDATCGQAGSCWITSASKQTESTTSSSWRTHTRSRALSGNSSAARGHIDICEIQAWSNDPCSAKALPSFAY